MTMRATTVRFGEDVWHLLEREAEQQGISSAQFVRDATIMRIAFLMAERREPGAATTIEDLGRRMAKRRRQGVAAEAAGRAVEDRAADKRLEQTLADPNRIARLHGAGLLDTVQEETFDRFTRLAARVLNVPVALVTLVARDRQFFKSQVGLPEPYASERQTPLSHSFCQHAVARREPLIIEDAREHPLVRENLAIRDINVIAYAGVPLITSDGQALGAFCAIDERPRLWSSGQIETLKDIAGAVTTEIELRAAALR